MAKGKYQRWLEPENLRLLEDLAGQGMTDEHLMVRMGVKKTTFYRWLEEHREIREAITRGRGHACAQVENAMYEASMGGVKTVLVPMKRRVREYDQNTGKLVRDEEEIVQVEKQIYVPTNDRAGKFWLTNRDRTRWAERPIPETGGDGGVQIIDDI